jgi:hypothetical protein
MECNNNNEALGHVPIDSTDSFCVQNRQDNGHSGLLGSSMRQIGFEDSSKRRIHFAISSSSIRVEIDDDH